MNTRTNPLLMIGGLQDLGWVAGPAAGLGPACARCCPPARYREPDPRRWLDSTARPDAAQLAAACALAGFERHTATVLRTAELTRQARRRAQQLFLYVSFPRDAGRGDSGSDGAHERSSDDACPEEVPAGVA